MMRSVIVLGAGMVGVSVALHLRRRGCDVVLVDRQAPGEGASFGNAGLIQREAVYPHAFPRALDELRRIARNRAIDVAYHPLALPQVAPPLLRYWWNSHPERYLRAVLGQSRLVATCLDEHMALARDAEAVDLLRPIGWLMLFRDAGDAGAARRPRRRRHGATTASSTRALDGAALAAGRTASAGGQGRRDPLDRPVFGQRPARADPGLCAAVRPAGRHDGDRGCRDAAPPRGRVAGRHRGRPGGRAGRRGGAGRRLHQR